jgi:hypothetical protein
MAQRYKTGVPVWGTPYEILIIIFIFISIFLFYDDDNVMWKSG